VRMDRIPIRQGTALFSSVPSACQEDIPESPTARSFHLAPNIGVIGGCWNTNCAYPQFWNPLKWFKGKLWWEVEAFKEQAKWYSDDRSHAFARLISTSYALDISIETAEKLLKA